MMDLFGIVYLMSKSNVGLSVKIEFDLYCVVVRSNQEELGVERFHLLKFWSRVLLIGIRCLTGNFDY